MDIHSIAMRRTQGIMVVVYNVSKMSCTWWILNYHDFLCASLIGGMAHCPSHIFFWLRSWQLRFIVFVSLNVVHIYTCFVMRFLASYVGNGSSWESKWRGKWWKNDGKRGKVFIPWCCCEGLIPRSRLQLGSGPNSQFCHSKIQRTNRSLC